VGACGWGLEDALPLIPPITTAKAARRRTTIHGMQQRGGQLQLVNR
jgi:hypothetical protein